ncbi:hypothetical protein [Salinithrix halophila]|uniref:Lipoprotein n=1 Tax=Salinithrix halophila TaxID=1485204 RepID=A0ABV8JI41_9BACL
MEKRQEETVSRTKRLTALFAAAALTAVPGCSNDRAAEDCNDQDEDGYCDEETCVDEDQDGYCDDGSGQTGSSYYYKGGKKIYKKISGISSGSKGGIGSSGSRSGGWFSGG